MDNRLTTEGVEMMGNIYCKRKFRFTLSSQKFSELVYTVCRMDYSLKPKKVKVEFFARKMEGWETDRMMDYLKYLTSSNMGVDAHHDNLDQLTLVEYEGCGRIISTIEFHNCSLIEHKSSLGYDKDVKGIDQFTTHSLEFSFTDAQIR